MQRPRQLIVLQHPVRLQAVHVAGRLTPSGTFDHLLVHCRTEDLSRVHCMVHAHQTTRTIFILLAYADRLHEYGSRHEDQLPVKASTDCVAGPVMHFCGLGLHLRTTDTKIHHD